MHHILQYICVCDFNFIRNICDNFITIKIYKCYAVSLEMFTLACYSIFYSKV